MACDRTGVSNRAAAMIVTAALHDINSESSNIIDRNKFQEKERNQESKALDQLIMEMLQVSTSMGERIVRW